MQNMVGESSAQRSPEEVKFGGVLVLLGVAADCVKPVHGIDIGRVGWAREALGQTQRFNKALDDIAAHGGLIFDDEDF